MVIRFFHGHKAGHDSACCLRPVCVFTLCHYDLLSFIHRQNTLYRAEQAGVKTLGKLTGHLAGGSIKGLLPAENQVKASDHLCRLCDDIAGCQRIGVPCYNEEEVLPLTAPLFLQELNTLIAKKKISSDSRVLFVNDGSRDKTWDIICSLSKQDEHFCGISQSRNRGHQNALLAGLMEAKDRCELTITIDCDGQDDISAMEQMVDEYRKGCDIVYGVRKSRETDTWFKRTTARSFYKLMSKMGVEMIYDHADYRLVSAKVLQHFAEFGEVNIFLRGMFPLVGFKSTCVYYDRNERLAGKSHYPLSKMLSFAIEGITSLSIKPLTLIVVLGLITCLLGFAGIVKMSWMRP